MGFVGAEIEVMVLWSLILSTKPNTLSVKHSHLNVCFGNLSQVVKCNSGYECYDVVNSKRNAALLFYL